MKYLKKSDIAKCEWVECVAKMQVGTDACPE